MVMLPFPPELPCGMEASFGVLVLQKVLEVLVISPRNVVYLSSVFSLKQICEVFPFQYLTNVRHNRRRSFVTSVHKRIDEGMIANSSGSYS